MKQALRIIISILIGIVVVIAAAVIIAFVFKEKVPIGVDVPKAEKYEDVNRADFVVATNGIEDEGKNDIVIYESTNSELEHYGQELRYISGRIEPLTGQEEMKPDIPTDYIPRANINASGEVIATSDAE